MELPNPFFETNLKLPIFSTVAYFYVQSGEDHVLFLPQPIAKNRVYSVQY
jgi:hypothetical protein